MHICTGRQKYLKPERGAVVAGPSGNGSDKSKVLKIRMNRGGNGFRQGDRLGQGADKDMNDRDAWEIDKKV